MITNWHNKRIYAAAFFLIVFFLLVGFLLLFKRPFISHNIFLNGFLFDQALTDQSTAEISIEGNMLKINFDIKEADKAQLLNFSQKLGITDDYLHGFAIELDQKSLDYLRPSTPAQVSIFFKENSLVFKSKTGTSSNLQSSLPKEDFNFATGSSSINLKVSGGQSYSLKVLDPKPLIDLASSSGRIFYSKKITSFILPILERIATISLEVNLKSINGEITLK